MSPAKVTSKNGKVVFFVPEGEALGRQKEFQHLSEDEKFHLLRTPWEGTAKGFIVTADRSENLEVTVDNEYVEFKDGWALMKHNKGVEDAGGTKIEPITNEELENYRKGKER